ncbi:hypothetical protein PR048_026445 [Dryococelus australis]|uniref:Uncharacterized protein n=1 Tax=Dryococelus australis TaxID=614101 RepID=A0ABQ9GLE8_9NEOP|nr:hypothetical protein PR048_026445 [Dryococelus australis]
MYLANTKGTDQNRAGESSPTNYGQLIMVCCLMPEVSRSVLVVIKFRQLVQLKTVYASKRPTSTLDHIFFFTLLHFSVLDAPFPLLRETAENFFVLLQISSTAVDYPPEEADGTAGITPEEIDSDAAAAGTQSEEVDSTLSTSDVDGPATSGSITYSSCLHKLRQLPNDSDDHSSEFYFGSLPGGKRRGETKKMDTQLVNVTCQLHRRIALIILLGATVAEQFACSPLTKAIRVQSPPGYSGFSQMGIVPDDAVGRRVFSGISRFPAPSLRCCSILISITLIGSGDLDAGARASDIGGTASMQHRRRDIALRKDGLTSRRGNHLRSIGDDMRETAYASTANIARCLVGRISPALSWLRVALGRTTTYFRGGKLACVVRCPGDGEGVRHEEPSSEQPCDQTECSHAGKPGPHWHFPRSSCRKKPTASMARNCRRLHQVIDGALIASIGGAEVWSLGRGRLKEGMLSGINTGALARIVGPPSEGL